MTTVCRVKIAQTAFAVESEQPEFAAFFREYLTDEPPEFVLRVSPEETAAERERLSRKWRAAFLSDFLCERVVLLRKLSVELIGRNVLLLHGSVVAVGDDAHLLLAKSGVGKSTHSRLWLENIPGSCVVNGDQPFLLFREGKPYACGSPWGGKEGFHANRIVPLRSVVLFDRGAENQIWEIPPKEGFDRLLDRMFHYPDPEAERHKLRLLKELTESVCFYRLRCGISPEAARTAYEGLSTVHANGIKIERKEEIQL